MIHLASRPFAARAVPLVALAAVLLSGCGSSATGTGAAAGSSSPGPAWNGAGGFEGVAGAIASVGDGSFTVTATGGTDTVNYTGSTVFDKTAPATLADVTGGSCVAVTEASGSDPSTGSVDATAVRVSRPVNGTCPAGFGGGAPRQFGAPAAGGQSGMGTGNGNAGGTSGLGGSGSGGRGMLIGAVESVSGSSFVVDVTTPGTGSGETSSATTTTTVNVSRTTTYSVTTAAAASDLALGECVRAVAGGRAAVTSGAAPAPATGGQSRTLTATSVTLSARTGGSCPTQGQGRRGAAGASGSADASAASGSAGASA